VHRAEAADGDVGRRAHDRAPLDHEAQGEHDFRSMMYSILQRHA
jgi:hypothetical protein